MVDPAYGNERPSFVIGNIAKGHDMWDRETEIDNIWKRLKKDNVLFKACRRFGKTSIMNKMCENPIDSFTCFLFDVESMNSPQDFVVTLFEKLRADKKISIFLSKANKFIKKHLDRVEVGYSEFSITLREDMTTNWHDVANKLINDLLKYDGKILFMIDELPELILKIAKNYSNDVACDFLNWLRTVRQSGNLLNIRWLFAGSIGIEHALKKVGAKVYVINDLSIIVLNPFSDIVGKEYIEALLKKEGNFIDVPANVVEKILGIIGPPVPYFLQILINESLIAMETAGEAILTDKIIEEAYHKNVLGPASKTYFEHYYERLSEYYDRDEEIIVKRILVETAKRRTITRPELVKLYKMIETGEPSETRFNDIMADIQNDFYVEYDYKTDSYRFLTNVLKDWWLRYHNIIDE